MPTAHYKGISMPIPCHTDPSDLAMIRNWFYPERITAQQPKQAFDPYNPVIVPSGTSESTITSEQARRAQRFHNYRRAIERVDVYTWRSDRVPHAITATASLIDAKVHHEEGYKDTFVLSASQDQNEHIQQERRHFRISTLAMKSIYAMAFCRFVNGFVDRDVAKSTKARREARLAATKATKGTDDLDTASSTDTDEEDNDPSTDNNDLDGGGGGSTTTTTTAKAETTLGVIPKGAGESSMYAHASAINMPSSFVDLRHKATHGKTLPTLSELQTMTDEALKWLWENWWSVNCKGGDAELKLWEVQRWDDLMAQQRRDMIEVQGKRQMRRIDGLDTNEIEGGEWHTVTEDGITKFKYISG